MDLEDRMKVYEGMEAGRRLIPLLPVIARLDGRSFHTFTKNMNRPFDKNMSDAMLATAQALCEETNCLMAYTQSDEINLTWYSDSFKSQIFFDGRTMKMTSVLASLASVHFNEFVRAFFNKKMPLATFDCRVFNVPNVTEGANVFLWREQDATRNSIQMAAQRVFSPNQLHGKGCGELQEMLFQKGINWNDYPPFFKRGVFIQRRTTVRVFTASEMEKLPPKHEARLNPNLVVERSDFKVLDMPPFGGVTNRPEVIYQGADPKPIEGDDR